jgi:hypothetical protein
MLNELTTVQGENLSGNPWQVYPRPLMERESYVNLNGMWDFAVSRESALPETYDKQIQVPFCPESALSGLKMAVEPGSYLFYRRQLSLPDGWNGGRVLLHIGAADQVAEIYVNQQPMGQHQGGYNAFTVDITDALSNTNELVIRVFDDLRDKTMPYGKQTLTRGGMWYTPVSGIWQTVWLECVPEVYIQSVNTEILDFERVRIRVTPALDGMIHVDGEGDIPLIQGIGEFRLENAHLWSPEDPYLYRFTVRTSTDRVRSYFAVRTIRSATIDGIPRLLLNGKPYFFHGLLDQGYWPDGIYTPATPVCYAEDILAMKKLGFNTLRKHIKVEPEEFYYQCDKLGMVVFQDMVNNGDYQFFRDTAVPTIGIQRMPDKRLNRDPVGREMFYRAMEETVNQLKNHPCILYWTIFNEGWGQFESDAAYRRLRKLDSSRIIDSTSGWHRRKKSDVQSLHIYFGSWYRLRKCDKPLVLSEFGGYTYPVEGHIFNPDKSYGYKTCKSLEDFQADVETLYRTRILPKVKEGLCAAIYTQVSDVEDEINGFLTYDRKVCKADTEAMQKLADALQNAVGQMEAP